MAFTPLTKDQYQKAIASGFSPDEIIKNEQTRKLNESGVNGPSFDIPHVKTGAPAIDLPTNAAIGTANVTKNVAAGAVSDIMEAGYGLADTLTKGAGLAAGAVGLPGVKKNIDQYAADREANDPIKKVAAPITAKPSGKVGEMVGEAGLFAAPGGLITKGQKVATAGVEALNLGGKVLPYVLAKSAQIIPEMVGSGATQFAKSGGDTKSAAEVAAGAGIFSGLTHATADAYNAIVPKSTQQNVEEFLKWTGNQALKGMATGSRVKNAVSALDTMIRSNFKDPIDVIDKTGTTKTWDPKNTSFYEMPQVLYKTMGNVYKTYTDIAAKAGDAGASFGQKEFTTFTKDLMDKFGPSVKGKAASHSNAASNIIDMVNRFGKKNPRDGSMYFKNASPLDIQELIQTINKDVDPGSRAHVAEVANYAATKLRQMLDDKIENTTGSEYQAARTAYSNLKGVEKDFVALAKKAFSGAGSLPSDFLDGLATIDVLQGLLTGNPHLAVRGAMIGAVKGVNKYLRNPEVKLQNALRELLDGPPKPLSQRFTAPAKKVGAPPTP